MSTTTHEAVRPLNDDELASIELPQFDRKYVKEQPKYKSAEPVTDKEGNVIKGREFNAGGPKADLVVKYVMHGGYTRSEIATFVGCSVSRVGEVLWAMDAANVEHPELLRRRETPKAEATPAEEPTTDEPIEADDSETDEPVES
jgi:hypothetical protein